MAHRYRVIAVNLFGYGKTSPWPGTRPLVAADQAELVAAASGLAEAAPHYHGHRDRLRQRFLEGGSSAVAEYELLELILFRAIPIREVHS